ncbi:kappa-casein [Cricetulus griseus]|uniref:kappa-casein n=1 Tax=Cricetulus griseus TaxID=10029 RepID=UPI0015C34C70|nr:kappa-casein [Cricetulus griseus]
MMRNFIIVVNILALTLPLWISEVQGQEQLACYKKDEILYDQKRVLHTPVRYVVNSNPRYYLNCYYCTPSVAVSTYAYSPFIIKLFLLRSLPQISQWQPQPNSPQPTEVPQPIPSPSFLEIPTNENEDSTANPIINTIAPVESTTIPVTEQVITTVVNPEASTVSINNPETATVQISSPA